MSDNTIDFESDNEIRDPDFVPFGFGSSSKKRSYIEINESKPTLAALCNINNMKDEGPSTSRKKKLDDSDRGGKVLFEEPFFAQVDNNKDDSGNSNLKTISARCLMCKDKDVVIKGHKNVSSNFIKHLKNIHPEMYEIYQNIKGTKRQSCSSSYSTTNTSFNDKIIAFIADAMVPISIVENLHFINLFEGFGVKIMTQKACTERLNENYNVLMNKVRNVIFKNKYFCTTADIWLCRKRSYFGYTCHWIDENFNRLSAALTCKRFTGLPSFNRISDIIHDINEQFGLNHQNIVATVTDNGSNYMKAIKQNDISPICLMEENGRNEDIDNDLPDFLSFNGHQDLVNALPNKHIRCATHALNLIASTDFINELKKNPSIYEKHLASFSMCSKLWDQASRSKSNEIITSTLGISLGCPKLTQWHSTYSSIKIILFHKEKLTELCDKLKLSRFSLTELEYLEEYCMVMSPLSESLDFLQGEKATFYGYLIPILATLKVKFDRIATATDSLKFLNNEVMAMAAHLMRRFNNFFVLKEKAYDALVASVTCPSIKFRWLNVIKNTSNKSLEDVKDIVLQYANQISGTTNRIFTQQQIEDVSYYFDFDDDDTKMQPSNSVELNTTEWELLTYSNDKGTNFEILKKYPTLMKLFLKYNSVLPSSAPVEKLFPFTDIINAPNRDQLSDSTFEKLVLLKANVEFKEIN